MINEIKIKTKAKKIGHIYTADLKYKDPYIKRSLNYRISISILSPAILEYGEFCFLSDNQEFIWSVWSYKTSKLGKQYIWRKYTGKIEMYALCGISMLEILQIVCERAREKEIGEENKIKERNRKNR